MTKESFRPLRLLTIGLGIAVFVLLLIALCSLSQGVKWAGSVLLLIPERVGLVRTVRPAEVFEFDMTQSPEQIRFARAGLYQVYTSDYDLLVTSDQLAQSGSPSGITVTKAGSDAPMVVTHITRGLLPYDTPHASGRPVPEVQIPEPGDYVLDYRTRPAGMSMVPDYVTEHEALIYTAFAIELQILALPVAILVYRREQRTWQQSHEKRVRSVEQFKKIRRLARGHDAESNEAKGPSTCSWAMCPGCAAPGGAAPVRRGVPLPLVGYDCLV